VRATPAKLSGSTPIGKTDVPGDVIVKARQTPQWRRVDRNKSPIAHEMTRANVKDHNPVELEIAVSLLIKSVRKETGSRLRVDQFRPKTLDLAREDFRCLNGKINRVRSKFCSMLFPVFAGAPLGQPDLKTDSRGRNQPFAGLGRSGKSKFLDLCARLIVFSGHDNIFSGG
jgi:hypothetical protein